MTQTVIPLIPGNPRIPAESTTSRPPIGPVNPNDNVVKGWPTPAPNSGQRTINTV